MFLEDPNLSWKAKGVLCYLLSLQAIPKNPVEELTQKSTEGKTAVRSAINELIKAGYIQRKRKINPQGQFSGWGYAISDRNGGSNGSQII